jgi:hypothetical protein
MSFVFPKLNQPSLFEYATSRAICDGPEALTRYTDASYLGKLVIRNETTVIAIKLVVQYMGYQI